MTMQELSTAVQYRLPIKIFILNNNYIGMVAAMAGAVARQTLYRRLPRSFAGFRLAEAYRAHGIHCEKPGDLDHAIKEMIGVDKPVSFDCVVDPKETASR